MSKTWNNYLIFEHSSEIMSLMRKRIFGNTAKINRLRVWQMFYLFSYQFFFHVSTCGVLVLASSFRCDIHQLSLSCTCRSHSYKLGKTAENWFLHTLFMLQSFNFANTYSNIPNPICLWMEYFWEDFKMSIWIWHASKVDSKQKMQWVCK